MSQLSVSLPYHPNLAIYPRGAVFGPRTMIDYEIQWIIEGKAHYIYEHGDEKGELTLGPNSVLLGRPGRRETFIWDNEKTSRHGYFHFSLLQCDSPWPSPEEWPLTRVMEEGDLLDVLSRHILSWALTGSLERLSLVATAFLGAFLTGETQLGTTPNRRWPEAVEKALDYIQLRLEEDAAATFDLKAIARAAFVSPEHLCRVFKSATGRSPLETVRLARLDQAALLLSRSNFPVAQVARLTGFASPFHFSTAFKRAYGISPRELQKASSRGESLPSPQLVRRFMD